jgi:hypothetical protein
MKETGLNNAGEVEDIVCKSWSKMTSTEVQPVFQERMRRLGWLCERDGEYLPE